MSTAFEQEHVHAVYETISSDFARTRHTPWLFVERYLADLPAGSVVLDAGCGNGKYLGCSSVLGSKLSLTSTNGDVDNNSGLTKSSKKGKGRANEPEAGGETRVFENVPHILPIGFDMSHGLLAIAAGNGHEAVRGDCFDLSCWRRGVINHAISVAIIHHFATPARRVESIKQLILAVTPPLPSTSNPPSPQGTILIVVWALEQDPTLSGERSARRTKKGAVAVPTESLAQLDLEPEQDVFVSWALQNQTPRVARPPKLSSLPRAQRPTSAHPPVPCSPAPPVLPPSHVPATLLDLPASDVPETPSPTLHRYYHLFRAGELAELVEAAKQSLDPVTKDSPWQLDVALLDDGEWWERENWVVKIGVKWNTRPGI